MSSDFSILISLAVMTLVYLWGTATIWRRAGLGRGVTRRRLVAFFGGTLALLVALVSPLERMSGELFSAHMVQHLILILVAAPLLVWSDFPLVLLWALERPAARTIGNHWNQSGIIARVWREFSGPIPAWVMFTAATWGWHAPVLYEAALRNAPVHAIEHVVLLLTAMLFWQVLLRDARPGYLRYGLAVPYLFLSTLQSSVLGALMTFTSVPWYPYYADTVTRWNLTALQDQQIAGLVMWIPGGFVFTLLTIGYFAAWLGSLEQRSVRLQHREDFETRH